MRAEVISEREENDEYGAFSVQSRRWLMDTRSAFDLADKRYSIPDPKLTLQRPLILNTANGLTEASKRSREDVKRLGTSITPIVLDSTPDVLSVGRRCMTEGYSFVWPKGATPYFIDPRGTRINFQVDKYIPYLIDTAATPDVCEPEDLSVEEPDASRESALPVADHQIADPEMGDVEDGVDILDFQQPGPRSRQALQDEARSKIHRLTHLPKNPYCKTCMRAKVTASRSPRTSGSDLYKEAKKF
eukprot:2649819-Amphidinium_carterae.1